MNKTKDGRNLTTEDLWEIADLTPEEREAITVLHNSNLIRSRLLDITRVKRRKMFYAGELELDTSDTLDWKEWW